MSNSFATPKEFANAGLLLLKNSLVMGKLVDTESLDKEFKPGQGNKVYVKRPPEFIIRSGATASPQDVVEGEVEVAIDQQKGLDVQFTSTEETLNVDTLLRSKTLKSAMTTIATEIDLQLANRVKEFHSWVGTPGNAISTIPGFFAAPQRLDEMCVPDDDRNALLAPDSAWPLLAGLTGNAGQAGKVAGNALEKARIPMLGNCTPYQSQTVPGLTTGTRGATAAVDGASQNVTYANVKATYTQSLVIDAVGNAATVVAGEVFTIAGVYAVNPRTKVALPYLQQFTVITGGTSVATATATAQDLTITISPPIITSGAYQTVSAAPADDAVVTWLGSASTTYRCNAAFHRAAIKLVGGKLIRPYTGECEFATDPETGLSIRYWRYSDGATDTHNHRWDVLFGTVNADRRLGTRVSGA